MAILQLLLRTGYSDCIEKQFKIQIFRGRERGVLKINEICTGGGIHLLSYFATKPKVGTGGDCEKLPATISGE